MRLALLPALLAVLALPARDARADDRVWDGGGDGITWSDAENWSGDLVPGGGDTATIAGASVRLTADASVRALTLGAGATLDAAGVGLTLGTGPSAIEAGARLVLDRPGSTAMTLNGRLDVRGRLDIGGGTVFGPGDLSGPIAVDAGGEMRWTPTSARRTIYTTVTSAGTIRWEGGQTEFALNQQVTSGGLFEIALDADTDLIATTFGPGAFTITGTLRKTGAGTLTVATVPLRVVGGTADVQQGAVVVAGGARWEDAAVAVAAGATLRLAGNRGFQRHVVAGTLSGTPAGTFVLGGLPGQFFSTMVGEPGSRLDLGGTGLQLDNAELGGSDGTDVLPVPTNAGLLRHVGTVDTYLDGPFVNEGTFRVEGSGRLIYYVTATFANPGLLEFAHAGSAEFITGGINGGRPGPLRSTGTIRKVGGGTVVSTVDLDIVGGTVNVRGGTFRQTGAGRWEDATVSVAAGATLRVSSNRSSSPQTIVGTLSGAPAGPFILGDPAEFATYLYSDPARPGRIDIGGTGVRVENAQFGFTDGGSVTFEAPTNVGLMTFAAAPYVLAARTFRNEGTIEWTAGDFRVVAGGRFENAGLLTIAAEGASIGGDFFGNNPALLLNESAGTIRKTGAGAIEVRGTLTNRGRVVVAEGRLWMARLTDNEFRLPLDAVLAGGGLFDLGAFVGLPDRIVVEGTTAPGPGDAGEGVDTLTVAGPYRPRRVEIDVAGASPGEYDRLELSGSAPADLTLATLVVRPADGVTITPGQTFDVIGGAVAGPVQGILSLQPDVTFTATYPAGGGVRLTAVARTGGALVAQPAVLIGHDTREVTLLADGLTPSMSVRLDCTRCLDEDAHGTIEGTVVEVSGGAARVRFDLRSPRILGEYDIVVESAGGSTLRTPLPVDPLFSVPVFDPRGVMGIGIRPAPGLSWSTVNVYAATNSPDPVIYLTRLQPDVPDAVRIEINSAYHGGGTPLWVHNEDPEPARLIWRIRPSRALPMELGTGISPEDVEFPDPFAPGVGAAARGGDVVPFGESFAFQHEGNQHTTQGDLLELASDALFSGGNQELSDYAQNLVPGDPLASSLRVRDATQEVMDGLPNGAALTPRELMDRILDRLQDTNPQPDGFRDRVAPSFEEGLDDAFQDLEQETTDAYREAFAPARPAGDRPRDAFDEFRQEQYNPTEPNGSQERPDPDDLDEELQELENKFRQPPGSPATPAEQEVIHDITGPWDPNDKTTDLQDAACELGFVTVDGEQVPRCVRYLVPLARADSALAYTIHFENKAEATAPAEDVVITDTLDVRLDPSTFRLVGSSSDSTLAVTVQGQVVTFRFTGIDLPPNVTAPEGQGYVRYTVRPRAGWRAGEAIRNRASIVFDFNPPILTPTVEHVLEPAGGEVPGDMVLERVWPNPAPTLAHARFGLPESGPVVLAVFDMRGREVMRLVDDDRPAGFHTVEWSTASLASGVYTLRLRSGARALARGLTVVR